MKLFIGLGFGLNFTQGSQVDISPQGISSLISFEVDFERKFGVPELYIGLIVNISAQASVRKKKQTF